MSKKSILSGATLMVAFGLAMMARAENPTLPDSYQNMDANGDGVVSEAEYVAFAVAQAKAQFKQLDRDGNGGLIAGEVSAAVAPEQAVASGSGFFHRTPVNDPQREAFLKRVSAGPSMRLGGR